MIGNKWYIEEAERDGMPDREPKKFECDCGATVPKPISCEHCGHNGCECCMIKDETCGEWFCGSGCQDGWYHEQIRIEAIKARNGEIINLLDAWENG